MLVGRHRALALFLHIRHQCHYRVAANIAGISIILDIMSIALYSVPSLDVRLG